MMITIEKLTEGYLLRKKTIRSIGGDCEIAETCGDFPGLVKALEGHFEIGLSAGQYSLRYGLRELDDE